MEPLETHEGSVLDGGDNVALQEEVLEVGEAREAPRTKNADVVVTQVAVNGIERGDILVPQREKVTG